MCVVLFHGGTVSWGRLFAVLQSIGVAGIGTLTSAGIFVTTSGETLTMSYLFGESCEDL